MFLLSQTNPEFSENSTSRGLSFIELGVRYPDKSLWGEHRNMQELMCLSIGLGLMKILLLRELWGTSMGVPMLSISPEVFNNNAKSL
jgi:hypothetical protein